MTIEQVHSQNQIANRRMVPSENLSSENSEGAIEYNSDFFVEERENSLKSARVMVPLVLSIVKAKSVLDVGCGVGAFLHEFKNQGVGEILGIDGTIPSQDLLLIPEAQLIKRDIGKLFKLEKKFDLVVSLEVAEHLEPEFAELFVSNLTEAGDVILFSAAIPGQGGTHHVNEQWPSYWAERFERHGFQAIDCIRPLIWNNEEVDLIYAQNTILYVKKESMGRINFQSIVATNSGKTPLALVHPKLYTMKNGFSLRIYNPFLRKFIQFSQNLSKRIRN